MCGATSARTLQNDPPSSTISAAAGNFEQLKELRDSPDSYLQNSCGGLLFLLSCFCSLNSSKNLENGFMLFVFRVVDNVFLHSARR